jgi:hypothetical protein
VVFQMPTHRTQSISPMDAARRRILRMQAAMGTTDRIQSQFLDAVGRAHLGKARINKRLCSIGSLDPHEWDFPPKPRWMRWRTDNAAENKFDHYEEILDWGTHELVARFPRRT